MRQNQKRDCGNHQRCGIIVVTHGENNCDNYCVHGITAQVCLIIRASALNHGALRRAYNFHELVREMRPHEERRLNRREIYESELTIRDDAGAASDR